MNKTLIPKFSKLAVAVGVATLCMAAPAQAKVVLTSFELSPTCVKPGGEVTATVSLYNDDLLRVEPVYARTTVASASTGIVLSRTDHPRADVPFGSYSTSSTTTIPAYTPSGNYNVTLQLGSTAGGSQWGSATRLLKVRHFASLCAF